MPTTDVSSKKIDHSTIPPAVRRAAEEAERLQREASAQHASPPPQPGAEPPAEPPQPGAQAAPEPPQPGAQAAPEPPQPGAEPPAAPAEPPPDDQTWKQRYESQVGRTRRLQQDVQSMSSRIDELQRLLSAVQTAPAEPSTPITVEQLLTPEEREEWKEVLPVMEKRFKELYAPIEHELRSELENVKKQVQHQQQSTVASTRAAMLSTLDNHPVIGVQQEHSWRALNEDDLFLEWLKYPERLSGRQRHELLKEAYGSNDAGRVAAIFESYAREAGLVRPPAQSNGNGAGTPPPQSNGLERFAAPGPARSAPAAPSASAEPQFFTTGDISRFYADRRAGKWRGREKEADAYEAQIFAAQKVNRIRPGPPQP